MIADRVRMRNVGKGGIPSYYVMATDADFSGAADGEFVYIGSDDYVIIPHKIKGVTVTKTYSSSSIGGMFGRNASIVEGVATLEGHSITNMNRMFQESQATSLDLSSFNTSNVTNMSNMFRSSLATTLDLSNFDTSNVTSMSSMFNGSQATTLDLSSFDTSNVNSMNSMFGNSSSLTTVNFSNLDISKVTNINSMFYVCSSLLHPPVIPASVTTMNNTFQNCESIDGNFTILAPVPPSAKSAFSGVLVESIRVPAASVETYKAADQWMDYQDRIFPI